MSDQQSVSSHGIEFGIESFGSLTTDDSGQPLSQAAVIRSMVELGVLADELGVDAIGLGEHHRPDYAISSPETVLAGIATRTNRIRLGSAVTVLSTDDPIRVFERFSTVNALSNGRAEVIVGRGSFTESFPLFGYSLSDYEVLFDDKLDLFHKIITGEPVTWSGSTRPPLENVQMYPALENQPLRTWVGIGGSPESVLRAARYGLRIMFAIIGGDPRRFGQLVSLYKRASEELKVPVLPYGIHSHGFVADTDDDAKNILFEPYKQARDVVGRERGWPPVQRTQFEQEITYGSLYVGSPETVARKIANVIKLLGASRFDMMLGSPVPTAAMMRSVELYATQVIPRVRELLA